MGKLGQWTGEGQLDRVAHGLALRHAPRHGQWLEDARAALAEVDELLGRSAKGTPAPPPNVDECFRRLRLDVATLSAEELRARVHALLDNGVAHDDKRLIGATGGRHGELVGTPALARVRRYVAAEIEARETEPAIPTARIAEDWHGFAHTSGKRAVMVGGDRREERQPMLQQAFKFGELDWPDVPKNSPGRAGAVIAQAKRGKYDFVICLQRFISHNITDALFDLEVPGTLVVLAEGYGVQQLRAGFDRYLPRPTQVEREADEGRASAPA